MSKKNPTLYKTTMVDNLEIFYREAGDKNAPVILLLHGFPTSSHMFRNLIGELSDTFRLVAPDFPGFGNSSMPPVVEFDYTFDHLSGIVDKFIDKIGLKKFSMYVMDYGAPIGYRIAAKHPEKIQSLIVQNGCAYEEGLREFWDPFKTYWKDRTHANAAPLKNFLEIDITKWQYTNGVKDTEKISPDNWFHDQYLLDRPGNKEIQLQLFHNYSSNPPLYPKWQAYFREHQPPTLVVWGKNDHIFPAEGAKPYERDLKNIEVHMLDTGHFALEDHCDVIAGHMRRFLSKNGIAGNAS